MDEGAAVHLKLYSPPVVLLSSTVQIARTELSSCCGVAVLLAHGMGHLHVCAAIKGVRASDLRLASFAWPHLVDL